MKQPCAYNRIALLATIAIMLHVFAFISGRGYETDSAQAAPAVAAPAVAAPVVIPQDQTRAVQLVLKSFGYTIAVDGVYGPQTTKVVKSWQRSNGLLEDGIAGPITQASLGLSPASRGPQQQVTPLEPPRPRSVEQIIRDAWPDELEDRALTIAYRESRYDPTAHNYCCHGLFQIYWSIHRVWLDDHGVTSLDQLYDPDINARMAYALYQRSGGWGPWSQTNY